MNTPRELNRKHLLLLALLAGAGALLLGWNLQNLAGSGLMVLRGKTFGTNYQIKAHAPRDSDQGPAQQPGLTLGELRNLVDARLHELTMALSNWEEESEISRFNRMPPHEEFVPGADFLAVLGSAQALSMDTQGAFDPTIGPLVELWGFGTGAKNTGPPGIGSQDPLAQTASPSQEQIDQALRRVGWRHIRLSGGRVSKDIQGLQLDLSAIAKGYGVDEIGRLLLEQGYTAYLVEIGGEVAVLGNSPGGKPWQVGVEEPNESPLQAGPGGNDILTALGVRSGGVATSGSYRQFRIEGDAKPHHIIDPRTGRPTSPGLVSVTVVARDCMSADAAATALMVMGVEKGLVWVNGRAGIEALFMEVNAARELRLYRSSGFSELELKD
ncbi:MAG: FAD:protein FMN transferase [Deltaproteobacteria bacterium]|nr:FAD:protein FMN transferase [Deltaproteobacteria bacterium]